MNEEPINRASLEKLSFSDLVQLADEYGVDVPEDLDRRFLIAELLELAEESNKRQVSAYRIWRKYLRPQVHWSLLPPRGQPR